VQLLQDVRGGGGGSRKTMAQFLVGNG